MPVKKTSNIALDIKGDLDLISLALLDCSLHVGENYGYFDNGPNSTRGLYTHKRKDYVHIEDIEKFKVSKALYQHAKDYLIYDSTSDYAFKLSDGSLIQIEYLFKENVLLKQRLAFIQRPFELNELDFQGEFENLNDENIQQDFDSTDTDVLEIKELVEIDESSHGLANFRFDYDPREGIARELIHPKTHLTLSNCKSCRIPVSSPMTSIQFVKMIIDHFYFDQSEIFNSFITKRKPAFKEKVYSKSFFLGEEKVFRIHTPTEIF